MTRFTPKVETLERRDNPSDGAGGGPAEYVWDYVGAVAGDSAVGENWVGDVAPPSSGAKIRVPAGTGPMNASHLRSVVKWTAEAGYDQITVVPAAGLTISEVMIEGGTWQAVGDLVFGDGTFKPQTDNPVVFDNAWGGSIDFAPTSSLVFDGTAAVGSDFAYRGHIAIYNAVPATVAVTWKSVGWVYGAGGPGTPAGSFTVSGTVGFTTEGVSYLNDGPFTQQGQGTFYVSDGGQFQSEEPVSILNGVNAVLGKGSILNIQNTQTVEIYPGVGADVGLLVQGNDTNLSLYGNRSRVVASVAILNTGDDGLRMFDSGIAGADRYTSAVNGNLYVVNSDVQFSNTDCKGRLYVVGDLTLWGSSLFTRYDLSSGDSDMISANSCAVGGSSSLSAHHAGVHSAARQYKFIDTAAGLSGTFSSVNWNGFGSGSLSVASGDYFIDVGAP